MALILLESDTAGLFVFVFVQVFVSIADLVARVYCCNNTVCVTSNAGPVFLAAVWHSG